MQVENIQIVGVCICIKDPPCRSAALYTFVNYIILYQTAKFAVRSACIRSAVINAKGADRFVRAQNRYFRSF